MTDFDPLYLIRCLDAIRATGGDDAADQLRTLVEQELRRRRFIIDRNDRIVARAMENSTGRKISGPLIGSMCRDLRRWLEDFAPMMVDLSVSFEMDPPGTGNSHLIRMTMSVGRGVHSAHCRIDFHPTQDGRVWDEHFRKCLSGLIRQAGGWEMLPYWEAYSTQPSL